MPAHVQQQGDYELFETDHHHRILTLDKKGWYAWVQGQQGEILVHSDSDHKKDRTIQKGKFRLVDFEDDPKFKDMPHLFLEKSDRYQEVMLPNGLPTERDHQKKVILTDETITEKDLDDYLKSPAPAGPGEDRMENRGGSMGKTPDLPIENYNDLTIDEVEHQLDGLSKEDIRKLRSYEQEHKGRKTMVEAFDRKLG